MSVTKLNLLGTTSAIMMLAASLQSAAAADMAPRMHTKAPGAVMAAVYDWSGMYLGMNVGWVSARDCYHETTLNVGLGCNRGDGATVGGQLGYRWQNSNWVFGVEAQGNWADTKGSHAGTILGIDAAAHSRMDAFGLFTAQMGWAWNNTLLYVKGGAAVTNRKQNADLTALGVVTPWQSGDHTNWGGTVGAGIEFGFAPKWSLGIEYNHIFAQRYDTSFVNGNTGLPVPGTYSNGGSVDIVTVRLNYAFGGSNLLKY